MSARDRAGALAFGVNAETVAALWLRLKFYRILERRYRIREGEIDIIAARGSTIAFVEVKARATADTAGFALDQWRLRRVAAAAERLAPRFMHEGDDLRIDAILIVPRRWPRHLPNVWQG